MTDKKEIKKKYLVWVQLFLIRTFVLDQVGVVFTIMGILLLVNGMHPAPVFLVAVSMIHLCLTRLEKASPELRNSIGSPYVDIKRVELVRDTLAGFGKTELVTFNLVGRADKQSEVFGHLPFNGDTEIEEHTFFDQTLVKIFSEAVAPDIRIDDKQVLFIAVNGPTYHPKIFLQKKT